MTIYETVIDVLRHYRQYEVADENGDGYPLIDALTLEGHGIDMGIREIENIADAIAAALRREREPVEPQPDALALVAAAYRDAAEQPAGIADALKPISAMKVVDRERCEAVIALYESMAEATRQRTPADATAALAAIERAAYERGVQSALQHIRTWMELEAEDRGEADAEYPLERQCAPILALLTQEVR